MRTSLQFLLWVLLLCPLSLFAQKPDSSFGFNGNSILYSPSSDDLGFIHGGYIQSSGRILAGLSTFEDDGYSRTSAVVAYTPDGQTDSSFGRGDGTVILYGNFSGAYIAPQSDGKVVATGTREINRSAAAYSVVVERLTKNGVRDSSFGTNGITMLPTTLDKTQATRFIAVDAADYIYVGGAINSNTTGNHYFTIIRLTPGGKVDSTFRIRHTAGYDQLCNSLQLLPDGSLIAGYLNNNGTTAALVKYTHDGRQDSSFGKKGVVNLQTNCPSNNFLSVQVAPNGSIVAATGNGKGIWLYKVTAAGRPDHSFSGNGIQYTGEPVQSLSNTIITVDGQSRILLPLGNYRLKRFAANGAIDASFGTGGSLSSTLTDSIGGYYELALVSGNSTFAIGPYTDYTYSYVLASKYTEAAGMPLLYAGRNAAGVLPSLSAAKGVMIYPNPAKNVLTVSGLSGQTSLAVVNAGGQVLLTAKTGDALYRLPVAALPAGVYYLRINNGMRTIPFVKE